MSIIFTEAELGIVIFEAKNLHLRTSQPRREPTYDIWVSDTMQTSKWGGGGNKTISSFLPRVLLLQGRVVPQPSSSVLILKSVSQADGWGAGADPWLVFNSRLFVSRGEFYLTIINWHLAHSLTICRGWTDRDNNEDKYPTFSDNRPHSEIIVQY